MICSSRVGVLTSRSKKGVELSFHLNCLYVCIYVSMCPCRCFIVVLGLVEV